jgi:hypothetical protein
MKDKVKKETAHGSKALRLGLSFILYPLSLLRARVPGQTNHDAADDQI